MIKFSKPVAKYNDNSKKDPFLELVGIKVYKEKWGLPDNLQTSEELINKYDAMFSYYFGKHSHDVVGDLLSSSGHFIRQIRLAECFNEKGGYDTYIDNTLVRPQKCTVRYSIYKGFKFKLSNNHLNQWFSNDEIKRFHAPNQLLGQDRGTKLYLVEDNKTDVLVNYETNVTNQEIKDVYCSTNGRYIKYHGHNYYIKEQ